MVDPQMFERRIPTYRAHLARGAIFTELDGIATVAHYGDPSDEAMQLRDLAAADLNALPRCGFKNQGAPEWLSRKGIAIPEAANWARRQPGGEMCFRLGGTDILVTSDPAGRSNAPADLRIRWTSDAVTPKGWDAHREDGFGWFMIAGRRAPALFASVCAVDLSLDVFPDLKVAQTSAFGLGGVIARVDLPAMPAWHLFFDIASSDFLVEYIESEMMKFCGRFVGLDAVRLVNGKPQ